MPSSSRILLVLQAAMILTGVEAGQGADCAAVSSTRARHRPPCPPRTRVQHLGLADAVLADPLPPLRGGWAGGGGGMSGGEDEGRDGFGARMSEGDDEGEEEEEGLEMEGEEGSRDDVPSDAPEECPGTLSERAGKEDACAGCPNQSACASGAAKEIEDAVAEATQQRMSSVKHKLLVLSGKGGVGKSTLAVQLAMALSQAGEGRTTGILDVDVCGPSVPRMVGAEEGEVRQAGTGWQPVWVTDSLCVMSIGFMLPSKTDAVVWRGARKNALITQFVRDVDWGQLEYLVVDAPPGTSDEHITLAKLMKGCEGVSAIIVTTPQEMALLDVRKEINFCEKAGCKVLGVVENMAGFQCPNCQHVTDILPPSGEDGLGGGGLRGGEAMAEALGVPFLGRIPLDPSLSRASEDGSSVLKTPKTQATPGGKALQALVRGIEERLQGA